MAPLLGIALGLIQGLTEFLPVSSSGHLVIFQHLFGLREPAIFFDISVHGGTLLAVLLFFRKDLGTMAAALLDAFRRLGRRETSFSEVFQEADVRLALLIVVGSVPTAILGLLFHQVAEVLFGSIFMVGWMLLATGTVLWLTLKVTHAGRDVEGFRNREALIIGTVQGLAIIPGISRSGSTIAAGLFLGLSRETAARYSFLLSIPAILGAEALAVKDLLGGAAALDAGTVLGTATAAVTGYFALVFLLFVIRKGRFHLFAPYCWLLGLFALFYGA